MMMAIAQVPIPVDPTSFSVYGISGLLGFVCIVTVLVMLNIFYRQSRYLEQKDKLFTDSMSDIVERVERSNDKMSRAFRQQASALDRVLMYFDNDRRRPSLDDTALRMRVREVVRELEDDNNKDKDRDKGDNTKENKIGGI